MQREESVEQSVGEYPCSLTDYHIARFKQTVDKRIVTLSQIYVGKVHNLIHISTDTKEKYIRQKHYKNTLVEGNSRSLLKGTIDFRIIFSKTAK